MTKLITSLENIEQLVKNSNWNMATEEAKILRSNFGPHLRHELLTHGLCIPNLLLAGPARTATTWLRGALGKHPNIRVALDEPHILFDLANGNLVKCLSRYSKPGLWRGKPKHDQILCEKSPSYICLPDNCIRLLGALFPETKIILGQRDEISRLWSAIHHLMAHFEFHGDWQSFCHDYSFEIRHQIDSGRTDHHFQRWRSVFPNGNILVVSFCCISDDPRTVINRALRLAGARQIDELPDHERSGIERRTIAIEAKRLLDAPPEGLLPQIYNILDSAK